MIKYETEQLGKQRGNIPSSGGPICLLLLANFKRSKLTLARIDRSLCESINNFMVLPLLFFEQLLD